MSDRRIAVIGAGIVGTSIALALRKRGADVTLVDRDQPGAAAATATPAR
jgi:D-amino-acid dehydrogenase